MRLNMRLGRWVGLWLLISLAGLTGASHGADLAAAEVTRPGAPDTTGKPVPPNENPPEIFIAWGAPYGTPGAREAITVACGDTTRTDTLFITFDPGKDQGALRGIDCLLRIRPAPGDTLGPFWDFGRDGANAKNLRTEFDDPPEGCPSPWPVDGVGFPRFRRSPEGVEVSLTYFVPASNAGPVRGGTRYMFARVMLRLRRARLAGCTQPVCVELAMLKPSFAGGDPWITTGARFISRNSRGGKVCAEYRWLPPVPEPPRFGGAPPDSTRR